MKYYFSAFKNYAKSDGRATRKEYWWFILFHYVVTFILSFLDGFLGFYSKDIPLDYGYLTLVYLFASACPAICLQVRRLHDIGKSGSWWWIKKVPIISLYMIYLNCKASDPRINAYGAPENFAITTIKDAEPSPEEQPYATSNDTSAIHFSLSPEGEIPRTYGNYNVYGSDMALDSVGISHEEQAVTMTIDPQEKSPQISTPAKKRRTRYCSRCGNLVDLDTKKCTGCGKQYFRGIKLGKCPTIVVVLMFIMVAVLTVIALQMNGQITDLQKQLSQKQNTINGLLNSVDELQDQIQNNAELINFVGDYVVFVEDDGTELYHKYECYKFKGEEFWVFNTEAAKGNGYKACPYCH